MYGYEEHSFIFFGKVIEVTLSTIRMVLITKGEKTVGSIISFFEVSLYLIVVSRALIGITEDPLKVVCYSLGFAVGSYIGSIIESHLAFGTMQVQVIVEEERGLELSNYLRSEGYACTLVIGEGRVSKKAILYVIVPRKKVKEVIEKTSNFQSSASISVCETKAMCRVYGVGIKK